MESYLKSWEGIAKEYQNFSKNTSDEIEMKNSLKFEDDKEKVGCSDPCADSLPIHCVIQTFSSLKDLKSPQCQQCGDKSVSVDHWWECECHKDEVSGCIVVPEDTLMNDLVRTSLVKLGYPASVSSFATGSILIRNWKPLPLEAICPDMKKTVADILGEITAVVSLRIQIFRPKINVAQKMKDSLLSFLIKANQSFLRDSCCPFDLSVLSKFCEQSAYMKMHLLQEPPEDMQQRFDAWLEQLQETEKAPAGRKTHIPTAFFLPNNNKSNNATSQNVIAEKGSPGRVESNTQEANGKQLKMPSEKENLNFANEPPLGTTERPKNFSMPKTRVRTSFDPEFELPKLQKWYLKNPHPSRQQIYEYVAELNSLESRKGRKQLDINNVVYWFKNARAAQKRSECRRFSSVSATETNRCNVLKIPLGKNCGVTSDDQRSISDDEASVTSESGDDCRQENRCLQVVGKWNSNGQGEAVLEMQIPSRKSEFSQPVLQGKKDRMNEEEENSKTIQDESSDSIRQDSSSEVKEFHSGTSEKSLKENQKILTAEDNKNGIKFSGNKEKKVKRPKEVLYPENSSDEGNRNRINEVTVNKQNQSNEDSKKNDVSSKVPIRNSFPSCKENSGVSGSEYLSPYKSGFPVPPNSVLNPSFICMSQYMSPKPSNMPLSSEERRKRNRTFIDPVTEVPRLEQWFRLSTHPSHSLIARYTEELNNMPYRKKFPKLEAKNVQFWFKNRRAKNKRLHYSESNNN